MAHADDLVERDKGALVAQDLDNRTFRSKGPHL
jgi:hypothetical protein